MKASSRCKKNSNNDLIQPSVRGPQLNGRKLFLPALVALGGGLLAGPASALELGDIRIHSALGQPLRASVAYALQPNEQIHEYCIYLRSGTAASGLPGISNAAVTVAGGTIAIAGRAAIREPLLSLQVTVDCPYSAHLRRDYSVFLDPVQPAPLRSAAPASHRASPPAPAAVPPQRAAAVRPAARAPIASSGTYRVQPGDFLSGIASRISGRNVGIWQAAEELFAANPDAFINGDRDLLRAGAVLTVPDSILAPRGTAAVEAAVRTPAADAIAPASVQPVRSFDASNAAERASPSPPVPATAAPAQAERGVAAAQARDSAAQPSSVATPKLGDVIVDPDSPFVSPVDANAATTDAARFSEPAELRRPTVVENAAPAQTAPAVRVSPTDSSWTWAIWLGGSGIALILALLVFGRRLKARFLPSGGAAETLGRWRTDARSLEDTDVSPVLGLPAQGTAPVARMVTLDADLEDGSGLKFGDMDVAQDFGFSDSGEFGNSLDLDLGRTADGIPARSTGIVAPRRFGEGSIVVSEIPPQHEDAGEYDLSTIVDTTKEIVGESDDTTKDLRATEIGADEVETIAEEYDAVRDIDYKILEQDYEEELTATQALSQELARAARELSSQFGKDEMGDTLSDTTINEAIQEFPDDETTLLPSAGDAVPGDDETTAMPAPREAPRAADDTFHLAVSSNMTLDDTANEEISLDVPAADNDASIEVDVESATIDTRKMRA